MYTEQCRDAVEEDLLSSYNFIIPQERKGNFKGAQVWDFDVLDFNDFFIVKSI